MNGLDLFSGIGGISIALKPWVRTVVYCERDRYAQSVLLSRMASNDIDRAPIWDDVTSLRGAMLPKIDIIFGGFPCQDISQAGRGIGLEGKRSGLFYEIVRLTTEIKPAFVFLENVPAIRTRGLRQVVGAFAEMGYDCRWTCLSAAALGAPHKRERWFLLAYSDSNSRWNESRRRSRQNWENTPKPSNNGKKESMEDSIGNGWNKDGPWESSSSGKVGDTTGERLSNRTKESMGQSRAEQEFERSDWWSVEPNVGRVANGVSFRVDRLKCLGNAVVPKQAREAFMRLLNW